MQVIHPHKIEMGDRQTVNLPAAAVPLSVFYVDGGWILFVKMPANSDGEELVGWEISCFSSGRTFIHDPGAYLNTFNSKAIDGTTRIFHAFARPA